MPMSFKSQLNHFGSAKSTTPLPNFRDKIESGYESMSTGNDVETISNVNTVTSMETHQRKDHGIVLDQCDEEVLIKVRENIETLIEGFIGSSLDQAHVNKPYIHDKYDQILDEYQTPLAQAILNLTEALFLSLQNQPFINGNIPTNAHSHLKKLILHLNHLIGQLPKLPVHLKSSTASSSSSSSENIELDESQSYEDLLAIAIINELIKTNQERIYYSTSTMMTGEASSSSSSSSNSSSGYGDNHRLNRNVTQSNGNTVEDNYFTLTTPSISSGKPSSMKCTKKVKGNEVNGNNLRIDDNNSGVIVEQTEPSDGCVIYHQEEIYPESSRLTSYKGGENGSNVNIADIIKDRDTAYKIEEQIEEITTTTTAPDEDEDAVDSAGGSEGYKDSVDSEPERRRHVDCLLDPYGLDLTSKGCARVAFPELGLDIMDLAYLDKDDDEDDTNEKLLNGDNMESKLINKVKVVDDFSWEENWLFQKKRKAENDVAPLYCLLNLSESTNPVCMLIPNPSQIVPPFIGLTAVDQLSDLTERNSVGSLEFSSDEESDETEVQSSSSYPLENIKCSSSAKLKVPLNSASSASSSPFPASSLSSSSSTPYNKTTIVNNKQKSTKCLNSAANHKSSSPLAPLKIPDFIPSNKRSSSLTFNQPFIANSSNNNQTKSTNGPITNANNDDPTFTLIPQSANVQSDILIQFCCRVKGSQPLGVAWYRKGQFIGGTIERGRLDQFNVDQKDEFDQMSNKDGVETKDFKTFKHFTDHILEIKSTRVDLSGTYSACVYNHVNQHWIDFNVKIYPQKDYHPYRFPRSAAKSFQKVVTSPPPAKQRSTKANSNSNGPKVLAETFHSHCQENEVNNAYENLCHPDEASFAPKIASIAEREHKKWEESTVAWPDNPYTTENVGKRKHLNQFLDSLDPSGVDPRNRIEDDEANLHALPYISPSKDMGRFKRDYYVPNVPKEHETCNGFDEKVYSSVKYFSSSESPGLNYSETDLINSHSHEESTLPGKLLIPTVTTTAPTPTVSCSPSPSAVSSSSSCSPGLPRIINEHHLQYKHAEAQVLENLGNITSLVSVKELINRFSALKESTNPMNSQYLKDSTNFYSLNRDGTLANSGTGINPRLITDKQKFSVPFKLSCWLDDDNGDNNGHDMYHDENDNINDSNLYSPRNKVNCHENNAKSQSIEQTKDFNSHHEKNNCHHEMLYHQQEPNHVDGEQCIDYYQRSNSEVSLPTLMSPPPPILPPRPQPRLSTKTSQANLSQARVHSTKPQHPLAVNSITGRCLNKEYRNWTNKNQSNPSSNLMGSLSLYDINQASETSDKFQSSNPASPGVRSQSNAGYNSDDCNSSEQVDSAKNSTPFGGKKVVRRMAPSIMKRASFWEKRCEQEMST